MGLQINIEEDFRGMLDAFEELNSNQIQAAVNRAINQTLITLRKDSVTEIRKRLKIQRSALTGGGPKNKSEKYIIMKKARGMEGSLLFSKTAISLLHFVKGSKAPESQKGLKIAQRRKLRVEIAPGKSFRLAHAFIQRANTMQVFKGRRGKGFKKQGIISVGTLIEERGLGEKLTDKGRELLRERVQKELGKQMEKMQGKWG